MAERDDRRLRRFRLLRVPRRRRDGRARRRRSARRARPITIGDGRRPPGRVHPAPRPRPRYAPARVPAAGEPLGDAHARRAHRSSGRARRVRSDPTSIRATSSCSTNSSTARGAAPTRSTTASTPPRLVRRPVLPGAAPRTRSQPAKRVGVHDARARHRRRDPRTALLDRVPSRVGTARRAGTSST